jgi:tetratricopeptide (TPR) repeat protein
MSEESRFRWSLLALCGAAAALRALVFREELAHNPFAAVPWSDAALYWERAGALASGRWPETGPFLVAPLYPLLLGCLRALGLGLAGVYALQLALNLASGVLVGLTARARFGAGAGLLAAGLFLWLGEAALFALRLLSVTLQVFLAALLAWDAARLAASPAPSRAHELRVGLWLGLLVLAFPAALLLVPAHALWRLASAESPHAGLRRAALGAGAALLAVFPATLHNAIVGGELVLVTAHGGVTLAQGNAPESDGVYTPIDGIGASIFEQHRDAARVFEAERGRPGSWREVDAHFAGRARAFWLGHPGEAAQLLLRKLRWLAGARRYDNVAVFALERERGLGRAAAWLPLEIPFLLGLTFLGVALALREPRRAAPELALLALPALVCLLFYYSARYRLVAAPALCGLAAAGLCGWRALGWPRAAVLALALAPAPLLLWNARSGFESLDFMRADYARALAAQHLRAGDLRAGAGDASAAEDHYARAALADPASGEAWTRLHDLAAAQGRFAAARAALERLLALEPESRAAHLTLAWLLASCPDAGQRDGAAALRHADAASRLQPGEDPEGLLVRALAEAELGRLRDAAAVARRAAALASARGDAVLARDLERLAESVARGPVATPPRLLRGA